MKILKSVVVTGFLLCLYSLTGTVDTSSQVTPVKSVSDTVAPSIRKVLEAVADSNAALRDSISSLSPRMEKLAEGIKQNRTKSTRVVNKLQIVDKRVDSKLAEKDSLEKKTKKRFLIF